MNPNTKHARPFSERAFCGQIFPMFNLSNPSGTLGLRCCQGIIRVCSSYVAMYLHYFSSSAGSLGMAPDCVQT